MNGSSNRCAPPRLPFLASGRFASSHARRSARNRASSGVSLRSTVRSLSRWRAWRYSSSERSSSSESSSSSSSSPSSRSSSSAGSSSYVLMAPRLLRRREGGIALLHLDHAAAPLEGHKGDGADDDRRAQPLRPAEVLAVRIDARHDRDHGVGQL